MCLLRPGEMVRAGVGAKEKPPPGQRPEVFAALLPLELSPQAALPDLVSLLVPRRPEASLRQGARYHQYLQEPQVQDPLILRPEIRPDII